MPFYFSLITLGERIDLLLEKIEHESKMLEACGQDKKKERKILEKRVNKRFKEVLKQKDRVIKIVNKQKSKLTKKENEWKKRARKLEKKVDKARKKKEKFEGKLATVNKSSKYVNEEITLLKGEIIDRFPDKFYESAFVRGSLKTDENSFEFSIKNIFVDITFSKADRKNEDLKKATAYDISLSLDDEMIEDFEIIYGGKVYKGFEEGLSIKKDGIFAVKVYRKFKDGMRVDLAFNTFEYGIINFGKVLKS
jgi:predicted RNase H-like nuclease (RuvC/YqgF family)